MMYMRTKGVPIASRSFQDQGLMKMYETRLLLLSFCFFIYNFKKNHTSQNFKNSFLFSSTINVISKKDKI